MSKKFRLIFVSSLALFILIAGGAMIYFLRGEKAQPKITVRIEAEAFPVRPDLKIISDANASGGKAVSIARAWEPLLLAPIPKKGHTFTIWLHHKYGPLLVKAQTGKEQHDVKWVYDTPDVWTWTKVGRFSRDQLGQEILVLRGDENRAPDAQLDCIVLSTDDNLKPTVEKKPVAVQAPKGVLREAEKYLGSAGLQIETIADASSKEAVRGATAWQPLYKSALPAGDGFMVWVRHRGGPLLLKTSTAAGEWELQWIDDTSDTWQWSNAGQYARSDLGDKIIILRGGKEDGSAQLDAVVFSPQKVRPLPPFRPDTKSAPLVIRADVNWSQTVGQMKPQMWGVNDYEVLDPKKAADPKYQKFLSSLQPAIIRIHNAELSDQWTNAQSRDWNVEKIKAGLKASTGYGDAKIMLNIAGWPKWMSVEKILPPNKEDEFAALCGKLVTTMRDIGQPIAYWELLNENEIEYDKAGKLNDLWRLWNKIAIAVKKINPNAKVGGPAFPYPKDKWVQGFLQNCAARADFVSWHTYATGDIYASNETMFAKSQNINLYANAVRNSASSYNIRGRKLELFLTEYNIKWTWEPIERRQGNNVGAVFQAAVLRRLALTGIDGVMLWHAKGNAYGLMDDADHLRPPAYLYRWGRKYLTGRIARHSSNDDDEIELLPIESGGARSLLFINKSERTVKVPRGATLLGSGQTVRKALVAATGYNDLKPIKASGDLVLPGYSVMLLTTAK